MASAPQNKSEIKSNWRTEITGRGRYFHFRAGSGSARRYMRGGRIEQLPDRENRLRRYEKHVQRKKTKRSTRPPSNSGDTQKYNFQMAGGGREILNSES